MPDFEYVARELTGREVTGVLTAGSEAEVASSLSSRRLFPQSIGLAESEKKQRRYVGRRVRARHLAVMYSQLADLLNAGVPLLRSLDLLERQSSRVALKVVLADIREQVADGTALGTAMTRHPKAFSELAVSMVRAGEEGGFLEDVLKRIADFTEHQEELKGRVLGALAYPAFLVVAGGCVVLFVVSFFVDRFRPIFARMEARGGGLPWTTRTLMGFNDFLRFKLVGFVEMWALLIILAVVAGFVLRWVVTTGPGRLVWDRARLFLKIMRSLAVARFCRILGTLLNNGVPILNSLRIAKDATGNLVLINAIDTAADSVQSGKSLAGPLGVSGEFPEEVVEMIAVGEEANNLESVLVGIADNLERRTYRQLELMVRLLEPVLLLVIASMVVFVALGLLMPIFQTSGLV